MFIKLCGKKSELKYKNRTEKKEKKKKDEFAGENRRLV